MPAIETKNLVKKYGNTVVLDNPYFAVDEGEFYCLMGPNGSGKTTLSSIIASVIKPTSGEAKIFGLKPWQAKKLTGYIPQENFSDPNLTGLENINYFARMLGYSKKDALDIGYKLLKKVGLFEDRNKRVSKFSGGMKKRLELATILFPHIKIFILDEPTTGLDPSARRNFFGLIKEIKDKYTTVLLISHIGSDTEFATKVGFMDKGRIITEGTPEELKRNSKLKNIIKIELSVKNNHIREILSKFNQGQSPFETEKGYKICSNDTSEIIPEIVRAVETGGYKVLQIGSVMPSLEDVFFKLTGKNKIDKSES